MKNKKNVEFSVETVENIKDKLAWISSTIRFWHFEKTWPMNLITDVCDALYIDLDSINVSLSHIIDK